MIPDILWRRLRADFGIHTLTPFQEEVFAAIRHNSRDVLLQAETGSGKTLAYLLPLLAPLYEPTPAASSESLPANSPAMYSVLQPTRALVQQFRSVLHRLAPEHEASFQVTTPRLFTQPSSVVVVDEADMSLSPSCLPPARRCVRSFLRGLTGRLVCAGATFPFGMRPESLYAQLRMHRPHIAVVKPTGGVPLHQPLLSRENQHFSSVANEEEQQTALLALVTGNPAGTMVFVHSAGIRDHLVSWLQSRLPAHRVVAFPGGEAELEAMGDWHDPALETGPYVIVGTDGMSRGIDLASLRLVVHLTPPHSATDYLHRIGRLTRVNSRHTPIEAHSHCILTEQTLRTSSAFLQLVQSIPDMTALFSRNRSLRKQLRKSRMGQNPAIN